MCQDKVAVDLHGAVQRAGGLQVSCLAQSGDALLIPIQRRWGRWSGTPELIPNKCPQGAHDGQYRRENCQMLPRRQTGTSGWRRRGLGRRILQSRGDFAGRLVTLFGIVFQATVDDGVPVQRQVRADRGSRRKMPGPAHGGREWRRSTKRASASREFVEHNAQSVNVRRGSLGPALELLGSHVLRSAHNRPRQSNGRSSGGCLYGFGGEAEI